jgi:hypothetical protein
MREFGTVYSAYWSSTARQRFTDGAKLLGAFVLTCAHGTIAGVCHLPDGYVSEDLQWSLERVPEGFHELSEKGFAERCPTTKWVWIRNFLEWNRPENPNQWKAVYKAAGQIPQQCSWRVEFMGVLAKMTGKEPPPEANPYGTVAQPFRNLNPSQPNSPQQEEKNVSAVAPPTRARRVSRGTLPDPEWWLDFKLTYPDRAGDPNWRGGLRAANARLAEGHTPQEFLAGAARYDAFARATGKIGTEYVMQSSRFCGPSKPFLEPWTLPATKADARLAGNLSAADEFMRRTEVT